MERCNLSIEILTLLTFFHYAAFCLQAPEIPQTHKLYHLLFYHVDTDQKVSNMLFQKETEIDYDVLYDQTKKESNLISNSSHFMILDQKFFSKNSYRDCHEKNHPTALEWSSY